MKQKGTVKQFLKYNIKTKRKEGDTQSKFNYYWRGVTQT